MWTATELDDAAEQNLLRKIIAENIQRLKRQINGKVRHSNDVSNLTTENESQSRLFTDDKPVSVEGEQAEKPNSKEETEDDMAQRFQTDIKVGACAKDLAIQALEFIPQAKQFSDVTSYQEYLAANLPYNAVASRRRYASYLVHRFFPCGRLHHDLVEYASSVFQFHCLTVNVFCSDAMAAMQSLENVTLFRIVSGGSLIAPK